MSAYNFLHASQDLLFDNFTNIEKTCKNLVEKKLPLPAYELCIKASHCFNLLDSRGLISVTERQAYILRIRTLVQQCCSLIMEKNE